ncbi:MAG: ACP phosphodiesterase [Algoriphagus sp.]|nr:ACP phosphodiesterase [Algoriphagus sp.]
MNFLAHAYLSFGQEEILVGNFIADFVKGKELENYPKKNQIGIHLHRAIDSFTDSHPLVKEVHIHLRPQFGHYARVISDVFFDYFLAKNWKKYASLPLETYSKQVYQTLQSSPAQLPPSFLRMLYWMEQQNWLYAYRNLEGIQQALDGLTRRARFDSKMNEATQVLLEKEEEIEALFFVFFQDLETFAQATLATLSQTHDPA